jgi:hypothetical protein
VVPNFDYAAWPGCASTLQAVDDLGPRERIWLAQESRDLPGAERTLYAALPLKHQAKWQLRVADGSGGSIAGEPSQYQTTQSILDRWPTGEWLVTSRYHAALAGAWAGSKITIIVTNEKLRGIAAKLGVPTILPNTNTSAVASALKQSSSIRVPVEAAAAALQACSEFVRLAAKT